MAGLKELLLSQLDEAMRQLNEALTKADWEKALHISRCLTDTLSQLVDKS